jgi:hypothetical protein
MKAATRVMSKGQVVIPEAVRDRLRWRVGTRPERQAATDPIDLLAGCLADCDCDPLDELEAEHRAELERDHRR